MSLETRLAEMKAEIEEFTSHIQSGKGTVITYPDLVDDAESMGGHLADEIMDELLARARAHIDAKGVNVHNVTPYSLGTWNKDQFDNRLVGMLSRNSDIPLSFYGDREYLPPSVTGSFESSVNWTPYGMMTMFLEDNGTLMMLRTGSDGASSGVYYSYLRNATAVSNEAFADPVMTNAEYRPSYFPTGQKAGAVLFGNKDILIGVMVSSVNTAAILGYFISLTNGTYDMTKHTGIVIPANGFLRTRSNGRHVFGAPIGFIRGDRVFVLTNLDYDDPEVGGYKVFTIPLNDLVTGIFTGATPVTQWTINRGTAGVVTRTHLQFCDDVLGYINTTDRRINVVENVNYGNRPGYVDRDPATDNQQVVAYTTSQMNVDGSFISSIATVQPWVFEITTSKVIDVAKYFNNRPTYGINSSQTGWTYGGGYKPRPANGYMNKFYAQHYTTRTFYSRETGIVFTYDTFDLITERYLGRYKYPLSATFDDIFNGNIAANSGVAVQFESQFPSPVSCLFGSITNYGDYTLTGKNRGWNKQGKLDYMYFKAQVTGSPTYNYSSISNLMLKGFKPGGPRSWIADDPTAIQKLDNTVNETDSSGWQVSTGRWDTKYWLNRPGFGQITTSQVGLDPLTCGSGVPNALRNQIRSYFQARGLSALNWQGGESTWCDLVVPQRYTDLPAFVYGHHIASDRKAYFFIATVTLSGSRKAVAGASLNTSTMEYVAQPAGAGTCTRVGTSTLKGCGGQIAIRRVTGGFAIGIATTDRYEYDGSSNGTVALITYRSGSFNIVDNVVDYDNQDYTVINWLNYQSYGLMVSASSENHRWTLDGGTKMCGVVACTTSLPTVDINTLMTRFRSSTYATVMLCTQTASAWTVYFSDPTPAMIDGLYYDMPLYTHELNEVTDANKKFYAWVVRPTDSDELQYHITESTEVPTGVQGSLYIGFFTTDANGLKTVSVGKRVAVADIELSTLSAGQSMPVTSGVPATFGRLNWR